MKIISVTIAKGGTGKTTTALNLATELVNKRKKVLLIDLDPQCDATRDALNGEDEHELNVAHVLVKPDCIEAIIQTTEFIERKDLKKRKRRLDVIPSNAELKNVEYQLMAQLARENKLKEAMDVLKSSETHQYDYVIIDCPPDSGLFTINALVASDAYILPVKPEKKSVNGAKTHLNFVQKIKSLNPELLCLGVLITQHRRNTPDHQTYIDILTKQLKGLIFKRSIPWLKTIGNAADKYLPLCSATENCETRLSYIELADQVNKRIKK